MTNDTAEIRLHSCFMPHDDPDAALGFYRDALGWEVRNDVGKDGMRWITVGPVGQPVVNVVLDPPGAHPGITDEERETVMRMMAKGTYASLMLATKDLDAVFERLQGHESVEVVQEPTDQQWGSRDCALRDPAGNMVRIQQVS